MWDSHQEEAVTATLPKKFWGNPEPLFAAVVQRFPMLKGRFPTEIEENFCTGIYIPADIVPAALKWVERKVNSFAKPDRRLFRGLILVLKEAVRLGKAYWEGTDLPVPMMTMHPPENERTPGLEEWVNPDDIYMKFLYQDGPTLVFTHSWDRRTVHINLREWPPRTTTVWNECALSTCKSVDGRWLTVSAIMGAMYRARVRDSVDSEPSVLMQMKERKYGLAWAGFIDNRVIAVLASDEEFPNWDQGDHTGTLIPAYPLLEQNGRLAPVDELSPSPEKFPNMGVVTLRDGTSVFLWDTAGYEFLNGRFVKTFDVPGRWSSHDHCPLVEYESDGFFCFNVYEEHQGALYSVRRGEPAVLHLPKVTRIRGISKGPGGSILVHELGERGDLGKLYFPGDGTYIRIEPGLFADEDPSDIRSLHYVVECERLIAATPARLWAVPIGKVLSLARYNATTGRKQRGSVERDGGKR